MTAADQGSDELRCAVRSDLSLGAITVATSVLNRFQLFGTGQRRYDLRGLFNNSHDSAPSASLSSFSALSRAIMVR